MKKILLLMLIMTMVLIGCANREVEPTETVPTTEPPPVGFYDENSQLEIQTDGAAKQYTLPDEGYQWVKLIGDRLLLATDENPARLLLLTGETAIPVSTDDLSISIDNCQALFNGFAYYDQPNHSIVYLDLQLNQMQSIALPADGTNPVVSQDGNQIFYCVGQEIRALDITRKLSRLVKTLSVAKQTLLDTCFGGKVLICEVEDSAGNKDLLFISTENGQTLRTENDITSLYTYEDAYFTERVDGVVRQRIVGTLNGVPMQLNVDDPNLTGALELGGVIGYSVAEDGLLLNYYDISTGKKSSSVLLPGISQPQMFLADRWSGCIWLLVTDSSDGKGKLLRWDLKASAVQDDQSYLGTLYTAENPDTVQIDALSERVNALNKKYGVRIRIWKDAVKTAGGHTLVPEHQISAISECLDKLESVLKEFPKNFVSKSISSKVRICIVRSVDGESKGAQFWSGSYAFIALATGADIRSEFLRSFGSVIDSHVLGNSPKYDYWDTLNPSGFVYGITVDESFVTGETRYFVDTESMRSGTTDRSRVFWQAMMPDNAEMFKSDVMQNKLKMLCKAIRDAWGLERKSDVYPWEQYLTKSIAYKKK